MTSDALADLIVGQLNGLADKPIEYQAVNPPEVATVDAELTDYTVFVIPFSEAEEPTNLANETCREDRVVSVVVNGPIAGPITRATALALVEFLRNGLKGTELGGYLWDGNETVSLFDNEAVKTKNQFLSLFRATYYRFA